MLDLCEGLERATVTQLGMRWQEQVGIDLSRTREAAAATAERDGGEE